MQISAKLKCLSLFCALVTIGCGRHHNDDQPVDLTQLSTPIHMETVIGSTEGVFLTWTEVPAALSYAIYRCEVPQDVTQDLIDSAPIENCNTPIEITTETNFTDVPPDTAPQAYVYHLKACADSQGQICGALIASVAAAQAAPPELPQMTTNIGDDGRQVISGLKTTLHGFAHNASGTVDWRWTQESGPKVSLIGDDTSALTFVAPEVMTNTLLSFELRTQDDNGIGRPSKVAVTVVPANNVSVKVSSPAQITQSGHQVTLHARGSDANLDYQWRQISPDSPAVDLIDTDTANPNFIVPSMPQGGMLHFEVTATDPVTGRNASARTAVNVQYAIPNLTPILEPSQTPDPVPSPVPIAAPLLQPMQISQPLQVPQPRQLVPLPNPILVPPQIPPQALVLQAPPVVVATGGTSVELGMTASGGREPYEWQWLQTSGPSASLLDSNQEILTVELPVVDTVQSLTFQAKITDAEGRERTAEAVVQASLVPEPATDATPTPITPLEPRLVVVTETVPVLNTPLTDVTVTQTSGPELELEIIQQPHSNDTGTQVSVTAPLIKEHSAHATLSVRGKDAKDQPLHYIVPVLIMRPPSLAPAVETPPQVLPPQSVPKQDDPLVIVAGVTGLIVDEGSRRMLGVAVQGGKGSASYRYLWSYLKEDNGPDINFIRADTARMLFDAPAVDRPTLLRFNVQITDGAQTIDRDVLVQVNDLAATLQLGALAPLTVESEQQVNLSAPTASGGVQFATHDRYGYAIAQVGGTPLVTLEPIDAQAGGGNWRFTAPSLSPGGPDAVLQFEFTSYDRVDNMVKTTQDVIVKAPPIPIAPLVPNISSPISIALGTSLTLQADATGGTPPYRYEWVVHPQVQPIAGRPTFNLADLSASEQNPTLSPDNLGTRRGDAANYRLKITLRVIDTNNQVAETADETNVALVEVGRPPIEAMRCGDPTTKTGCTDLQLVLGMTELCPENQPYAMSTIEQIGDQVLVYRSCGDALTAYNLFIVSGDKDNPLCRNFSAIPDKDITCHLACYSNGCNIDDIPPDASLIGPVGSDGLLTIGLPPLP